MVTAVALVAGGSAGDAIRLGGAMIALQASIGALNDVVDVARDRASKPGKPIPAGAVSLAVGRITAAVAAAVGLLLSVPSGPSTIALAAVILGIGYGYDLRLRGTSWSWLPFAVGIPLLPVYAWSGAAGTMPSSFILLIPVGILAGAGLALANARADYERDAAADVRSVATSLGLGRAWAVHAVLLAVVLVVAVATLTVADTSDPILGLALVAVGLVAAGMGAGRSGGPRVRERAWELEAIGVGLLAAAWLAGVAGGGRAP